MRKSYLKELVYQVNGAAIEVHKATGPGLLESVYQKCLSHELQKRAINFYSELVVPVSYKGLKLDAELRCDFFVEDTLVVEIKSVDTMHPIFDAQLLTYMKLLKAPLGLLINFNVKHIFKEGQTTFVNEFYRDLPD